MALVRAKHQHRHSGSICYFSACHVCMVYSHVPEASLATIGKKRFGEGERGVPV